MIGQGQEFNPYLQTWFTLWPDRWSDANWNSFQIWFTYTILWCDSYSDEIWTCSDGRVASNLWRIVVGGADIEIARFDFTWRPVKVYASGVGRG